MTARKAAGTSKVSSDILATDPVPPAQGILTRNWSAAGQQLPYPAPTQPPGAEAPGHPSNSTAVKRSSSGSHASLIRANRREQVAWPLTSQEPIR